MPRDMVVLESAANPIKAPVASSESMAASDRQARKRELDRLCQRRKRKKDRDLIDRLQARINDLQKQADGGHFNSLLIDRENRQALTARHSERMMKIQALVLEDLGDVVNGGSKSPDLERGESAPAVGQQDNTDILSNTPHVLTAPLETVEDHHQQQVAEMAQSLTDRGLAGVTYGSVPFGLQDFNIASTNPSRLPYANVSFGQLGSILDGGDMSKHDNTGLLTVSTTCGECESHWTRTNDIRKLSDHYLSARIRSARPTRENQDSRARQHLCDFTEAGKASFSQTLANEVLQYFRHDVVASTRGQPALTWMHRSS